MAVARRLPGPGVRRPPRSAPGGCAEESGSNTASITATSDGSQSFSTPGKVMALLCRGLHSVPYRPSSYSASREGSHDAHVHVLW